MNFVHKMTQKIGVDMKVKNENGSQSVSVIEHIQKSWLKFQHTQEEKDECSFLHCMKTSIYANLQTYANIW